MSTLYERVRGFLDDEGWDVEEEMAEGLFYSAAEAENGTYDVVVAADDENQRIGVWAIYPEEIAATRRVAVALYVTRVNHGLAIGNLELDLDAGIVRCKASIDTEDLEITATAFANLVAAAVELLDVYVPGLRDVIGGADPHEAAKAADASDG
jgi:hypothetical protein